MTAPLDPVAADHLRATTLALVEVTTELREYRKTLHERFNHLHERLGLIDERTDRFRDEMVMMFEKHHVAAALDHERLTARVVKLEDFHIVIRTNWKALVTVASAASILIGWLLTHFGPSVVATVGGL